MKNLKKEYWFYFSLFLYLQNHNEAKEKLKAEREKIEAERLANPTQEDLLKDIRNLLQAQAEAKQTKVSKEK
mgnify:CR=1 FL=1